MVFGVGLFQEMIKNMGKEARFLLQVVGQGFAGDPQFGVRDEIVSMLLLCRPAYLLHLLQLAITNPRTVDPCFVMFEDLKPGVTKLLRSIIKHLADACQAMGNNKPTPATNTAESETMQAQLTKYIMKVEAQFAFSHGPSATVEWPQMWSKILTVAVQRGIQPAFGAVDGDSEKEKDKDKKDESDDATISAIDRIVEANLIKWLPSVKSVCPSKGKSAATGASLPFARGDPQSPTTSSKVKSEPTESTEAQASKSDAASSSVAVKSNPEQCMPTFNEIYLMHDLPDIKTHDVDVRDVVAIRSQIELFIMSWAKSHRLHLCV